MRVAHERVVFPAEAEGQREFPARLPPVAEVEPLHPLPRRAPIRLNGLADLLRKTEEERCVIVELAWRTGAGQRDGAVERECSPRSATQLGVPFVNPVSRNVRAEPDIVSAVIPSEIQRISKVGAPDVFRQVGLAGADGLVAAHRKLRYAVISRPGTVGSGDVQRVEAESRAGIGTDQREGVAAHRHIAVHQERRAEGVDSAHREDLHQDIARARAAAVDHADAACRAEAEAVAHQRLHRAVLGP